MQNQNHMQAETSFQHLWRRRNRIDVDQYADHAALSFEIFARLFDRLSCIRLPFKRIINISLTPQFSALMLRRQYPEAQIISLDLSLPLLRGVQSSENSHVCCATPWALPLADHSADLMVVHLSLSQIPMAPAMLEECRRVLAPEGQLMMSHYGLDTLKELRAASQALPGLCQLNQFADMHHLGDALVEVGFKFPVVDMECIRVDYHSALELFYDLRALGGWMDKPTRQGLRSKHAFESLINTYNAAYSKAGVEASFEVIYAHAVASEVFSRPQQDGSVAIPVHALKR